MTGKTVLIVEDCYLMAATLEDILIDADASVVHITSSVAAALQAMEQHIIEFACLDINLGAETSFPVADALALRGIPFVFVSAYDAGVLPAAHRHRPFVDKIRAHLELVTACRAATPSFAHQVPAEGAVPVA
jgi:CheY-like chemotaxis protein